MSMPTVSATMRRYLRSENTGQSVGCCMRTTRTCTVCYLRMRSPKTTHTSSDEITDSGSTIRPDYNWCSAGRWDGAGAQVRKVDGTVWEGAAMPGGKGRHMPDEVHVLEKR